LKVTALSQRRATTLIIASLLLFIHSAIALAAVDFIQNDLSLALGKSRKENRVMMIFFYTDWCGYCKLMDKSIFADSKFTEFSKNLVNIRINAERGNGAYYARGYGVKSYPTVIFVDSWGKELSRINGYLPPATFLKESQRIVQNKNQQKNARQ